MRTTTEVLKIGTRKSPLAMAQTQYVINALSSKRTELLFKIIPIQTEGDSGTSSLESSQGYKSAFTGTIEHQLLDGKIDVAVHSLKDLPDDDTAGLTIGSIPQRVDARDVFISETVDRISDLPPNAIVGTSSIRRKAQLQARNPDIRIKDIRGNVETRIKKIGSGYDGIILAAAGLIRLNLQTKIKEFLPVDFMLPSSGQGALAVQIRSDDEEIGRIVKTIENVHDRITTSAERSFSRRLGGDCDIPLAAYAEIISGSLILTGLIASREGDRIIKDQIESTLSAPEELGVTLAERILKKGGRQLLEVNRN
ncbi:MAG: hydroxymethylbilane synthase [Thaumarchaeota archaeon]|nr:hydroxymethylbilane synthase [Nitrososphaerota archaeon]